MVGGGLNSLYICEHTKWKAPLRLDTFHGNNIYWAGPVNITRPPPLRAGGGGEHKGKVFKTLSKTKHVLKPAHSLPLKRPVSQTINRPWPST